MATLRVEPPEPTFELHGIELKGSFSVYLESGRWYKEHWRFKPTAITQEELKKLTEVARSGTEVVIKFENGQGKAKIRSLRYDPETRMLTSVSIDLVDWGWV
jgi:hypothetical protein